ncbi:MAG: hypothetical protein HY320_01945 [Armatimonadetes bacterium]|nr:hypothetical protein [Armatimonadota bacterium]
MSDFVIPVQRVVEQEEPMAVEVWQISILRGDADTPSRLALLFRPLDAEGRWRNDVEPIRAEFADQPESADPIQQTLATRLRGLILDAVVADSPDARQFESLTGQPLVGRPVRMAGRDVVRALAGIG